jgi:hypothetical protein
LQTKLAGEFGVSQKTTVRYPSWCAARQIIFPNCPPPKIPMVEFGLRAKFFFIKIGCFIVLVYGVLTAFAICEVHQNIIIT